MLPRFAPFALLLLFIACAGAPRWSIEDHPTPELAGLLLEGSDLSRLDRVPDPSRVPEIPIRKNLRPCCAFGTGLKVKVGAVPVPGFRIGNVMSIDEMGPHTYDSGALTRSSYGGRQRKGRERNGLLYTCRGGFIDTAHVRDYADWTVYLAAEIGRNIFAGATLVLPSEGGERRIVLQPVDPQLVARYGLGRVSTQLAHWVAFQMSVWHEIATWYGWSWVKTFPETASAFSPEDLYSNMLGVRIGFALVYRSVVDTEHLFSENVNSWMKMVLEHLEPVPKEVAVEAMLAVDQHWWDSGKRLPDKQLTLRRNLEFEERADPWLLPSSLAPASLRAICGDDPAPIALWNPGTHSSAHFGDWISFVVELGDDLAAQFPFTQLGRRISQDDFPTIVNAIRSQNREEAGERADRPD